MPITENSNNTVAAIQGTNSANGFGVFGESRDWQGVGGHSVNQVGIGGKSEKFIGIWGESASPNFPGVFGLSVNWQGVAGKSTNQAGVFGESENWQGISGHSKNQAGAVGTSDNFVGVWAETKTRAHPALFAKGPALAGRFVGDVEVTGDIRLVNADCAENFDVNELDSPDPGTVMVLAEEGILRPCQQAYDKRVAGVISGAGDYRPAIILDQHDAQPNRRPIALLGKVYCKVDAAYGPVEIGDLLTTSPTPGHAMKAVDQLQAFGAVIGKALRSLRSNRGLIPVLIALQ
jgi:hypothetical protein